MRRFSQILALAAIATVAACSDQEAPTGSPPPEPKPAPLPLGVYEFVVTGIGGSNPTLSVQQVDENGAPVTGDGSNSLTKFGGLHIIQHSFSTFTDGPGRKVERYITMTYRVRNASGVNRSNITFLAYQGDNAIGATPFYLLRRFDGTDAAASQAPKIVPTGPAFTGEGVDVLAPFPDVLQVYTEAEVGAIAVPSDGVTIFPYGFVVRNVHNANSRTIETTADLNRYDGILTMSFRMPMANEVENDIYSLAFKMLAVEDSEVRMTESFEEAQDSGAVRRLRARAAAIGATTVTVLGGSSVLDPAVSDYPGQRLICNVRTAGPDSLPITRINNPGTYTNLLVLNPGETVDPCGAYFRGGTPARPATNVPYTVTMKAMDRFGNVRTASIDTVRIEVAGAPATLPGSAALVSGSVNRTLTYSDYGNTLLTAVGRRNRGRRSILVAGVTRTWTAGAATNNWHTNGNWSPAAVPMSLDSVHIPASAPMFPSIAANVNIMGVSVENGATLSLNAFDLTAGADVTAGLTGGINNTSGRLILAGVAKTVQGRLPRIRVNGTYSLTGNVTARAPVEVATGRITNGTFRLQAESN